MRLPGQAIACRFFESKQVSMNATEADICMARRSPVPSSLAMPHWIENKSLKVMDITYYIDVDGKHHLKVQVNTMSIGMNPLVKVTTAKLCSTSALGGNSELPGRVGGDFSH